MRVAAAATAPFAVAPPCVLRYGGAAFTLPLPCPPVKFLAPPAAPVPRDAFFAKWRALPTAPARAVARVERGDPVPASAVDAVLTACGLAVQPGLDPDPANAVAAGSYAATGGGAGGVALTPVMVRVEADAASGRRRLQVTGAADGGAGGGGGGGGGGGRAGGGAPGGVRRFFCLVV